MSKKGRNLIILLFTIVCLVISVSVSIAQLQPRVIQPPYEDIVVKNERMEASFPDKEIFIGLHSPSQFVILTKQQPGPPTTPWTLKERKTSEINENRDVFKEYKIPGKKNGSSVHFYSGLVGGYGDYVWEFKGKEDIYISIGNDHLSDEFSPSEIDIRLYPLPKKVYSTLLKNFGVWTSGLLITILIVWGLDKLNKDIEKKRRTICYFLLICITLLGLVLRFTLLKPRELNQGTVNRIPKNWIITVETSEEYIMEAKSGDPFILHTQKQVFDKDCVELYKGERFLERLESQDYLSAGISPNKYHRGYHFSVGILACSGYYEWELESESHVYFYVDTSGDTRTVSEKIKTYPSTRAALETTSIILFITILSLFATVLAFREIEKRKK